MSDMTLIFFLNAYYIYVYIYIATYNILALLL